jgi:tRNA (cytosine38-C5)-methyltransferase
MRYSLAKAYPQLPCHVKAVDINEVANSVYTHNFGDAPSLISIEHLCASDFDKDLAADLWTLSPPCQPFTTTVHSRQQDDLDHRSRSFLHLLQLLPQLEQPPTHLLLENVPAFLGSTCHQQWRAVLEACQYSVRRDGWVAATA